MKQKFLKLACAFGSALRYLFINAFCVVAGAVLIGWVGHYFTHKTPDLHPCYFAFSGGGVLLYWLARLWPTSR